MALGTNSGCHQSLCSRNAPTPAEALLWERLRGRKLRGLKFRRQHPFEGFILDFYCEAARLGVEVDGHIHETKQQRDYDRQRTNYLAEYKIQVIRFGNHEVLNDTDKVLQKIAEEAHNRMNASMGNGEPAQSGSMETQGKSNSPNLKYFQFSGLLQGEGWLSPAYVGVDEKGTIRFLSDSPPAGSTAIEYVAGFALPGFQNAHSHAFQYAMAGLAENHPAGADDDFWTWREAMYRCALAINPEQMQAIAAMLYAEMVRHGYTQVAEFHYLHHDPDGRPYHHPAEMGGRLVAAAAQAGIRLTLIPVFYQKGNFGVDPQPRQRRFISKTLDEYVRLFEATEAVVRKHENASTAVSVHSLRAVDFSDVQRTLAWAPATLPIHLHVSEQLKEVTDCLAYCGQRPMQWLLNHADLNSRFHLVHSTHLDDPELNGLAKSGANVVLCPSTEGNLGDGIFRMKEYVQKGGRWSIGTDSHIGLNPFEELRMIDYRQRLITHKRNSFSGDAAQYLIHESVTRGRWAMGKNQQNHFDIGQPLDALVVNSTAHLAAATSARNRLATLLYTSDSSRNLGTLVGGRWVVKNQHHRDGHAIKVGFGRALRELANR